MRQAPLSFVEKYYLDDLSERNTKETKWYLSFLKNIKGKRVLSLGCGPNLYDDVLFFSEIPEEIVGIDINKNNIEFLKKSKNSELLRCKNFLLNKKVSTKLIVGDILKTREEFVNYFDSIYAMGTIGMLKEKQLKDLLKDIHKYLKPKGIFLDIDWTENQLPKEKYKERKSYNWYDIKGPGISKIGKLMKNTGFKILKHEVYDIENKKEYMWGKMYVYLVQKI